MPRETLDITKFGGIVSNYDDKDISINYAGDSSNIDGNAPEGKIYGIKDKADHSSHLAVTAVLNKWVKDTSKWNLVYGNGSTLGVVEDFYGTPANTASGLTGEVQSLVVNNKEVYAGIYNGSSAPFNWVDWFGRIEHTQFSVAAPTTFYYDSIAALPYQNQNVNGYFRVVSATGHSGTMVFDQSMIYSYAVTAVFDGYQESPMGGTAVTFTAGANYDYASVLIECVQGQASPTSINKRITSVKLYRKETKVTKDFINDVTAWKLLVEYDVTSSTGWTNVGGSWQRTYNDTNTNIYGNTYEQETGLSSIPTTHMPNLGAGGSMLASCNDYMFITRIYNETSMLYRSMPKRFCLFDTVLSNNNYKYLPTVVTAMIGYAGKLWVFDENRTYRVDPETLNIDSQTEGIGCLSNRGICATEYGLFWCDARGAYWFDGSEINPISERIKDITGSYDWHGFAKSYSAGSFASTPIVLFHPESKYVLFVIPDGAGAVNNIWAYNIVKNRWDKWTSYTDIITVAMVGGFTGRDGEVYITNGSTKVYKAFAGSRKSWTWTTKTLDFDDASQNKRFYELETAGTGTPTVEYSKDGGSLVNNATTPLDNMNAKTLKTKLSGTGSVIVDSLSMLFRRLIGKR